MWRLLEYLLHVSSHVQLLQHLVTLVQDEVLDLLQRECLLPNQGQSSTRSSDYNVGRIALQCFFVLCDGNSSEKDRDLK